MKMQDHKHLRLSQITDLETSHVWG